MSIVDKELARLQKVTEREKELGLIALARELAAHCEAMANANVRGAYVIAATNYRKWKLERE